MKRILTTAAMALMLTTAAFADGHSLKLNTYTAQAQTDIYASKMIGMRVYTVEKDYDALNNDTAVKADSNKEWDDIGEVNDVILGRDGTVKAVILGVGGFIGIGEKDVAVSMDSIKMVREDGNDDFFLVVNANKETLTAAETFTRTAKTEVKTDTPAASTETTTAPVAAERSMLKAPEVTREGYRQAKLEEITTETLTGARVYGSNDEDVGEINRLVVDDKGQIKLAVLDIGGFLGINEHQIAVTMDELRILRTDGGDDVKIFIDGTQSELEKQPVYKD